MNDFDKQEMQSILDREDVMAILREAKNKLSTIGIPSAISPCHLNDVYGMTVSLHIACTERGVNAAHVAQTEGAVVAHTKLELFAQEVENLEESIAIAEVERLKAGALT